MSIEDLSEALNIDSNADKSGGAMVNAPAGSLTDGDSGTDAGTDSATTIAPAAWLESVDADLRSNKSLSKFTDVGSLAKSYIELDKRVALPAADADDEVWDRFYKNTGMPVDGKYLSDDSRNSLVRDGVDGNAISAYEELFKRSGLSTRQGQKLLDNLRVAGVESMQEAKVQAQQLKEQNFQALSNKYGSDIDQKIKLVQASMQRYGNSELAELVEASNFDPALIDLLIQIGEPLQSDSLVSGESKNPVISKETAIAEIKKLESDRDFMLIYNNRDHAGNAKAIERMQDLYNLAYN